MIKVSPILLVAPLTRGTYRNGIRLPNDLEGTPWLTCAEYGFTMCVEGIAEAFKPMPMGTFVRLYVSLEKLEGYEPYSINDVPKIGGLADKMMLSLFGCKEFGEEFDEALGDHLGVDRDEFNTEEFLPGVLYYKVVPV